MPWEPIDYLTSIDEKLDRLISSINSLVEELKKRKPIIQPPAPTPTPVMPRYIDVGERPVRIKDITQVFVEVAKPREFTLSPDIVMIEPDDGDLLIRLGEDLPYFRIKQNSVFVIRVSEPHRVFFDSDTGATVSVMTLEYVR